ncbi:MAG: DUF1330 domain-containing protein [Myxococcota bacterium]
MRRSPEEIEALVRELVGTRRDALEPSPDSLRALLALDVAGPLQFLNLLAYHETARYPGGHALAASPSTGADAYARYGGVAVRHVTARGGRLVLLNPVELQLIGDADAWDQVAIMLYPDVEAFVDMIRDPDYRAAWVHRDAGLARTRVYVTRPLLPEPGSAAA